MIPLRQCPKCKSLIPKIGNMKLYEDSLPSIGSLYISKKLKRLTFYHTLVFSYDYCRTSWFEIDLLTKDDNFFLYLPLKSFLHGKPSSNDYIEQRNKKIKIYSEQMPPKKVFHFLNLVFLHYDFRLFSEPLLTPPAYICCESVADYASIILEMLDGTIKEIKFKSSSVANNIFYECIKQNEFMNKWLGEWFLFNKKRLY